jgi:cytochrome c5
MGGTPFAAEGASRPRRRHRFNHPPGETSMSITTFSFARQVLPGVLVSGMGLFSLGAQAADGKAVYDKTCVACHASGVANAPKLGDKAAWAPRVGGGRDALVASVIKGKGAMPPKAGNADLKEDDIKAAVEFMLAAVK